MIMEERKAVVLSEDDHYMHMQIHNKLPDSKYKTAHINAHKKAMIMQKMNPELMPQQNMQTNPEMLPEQNLPNPAPQGRQLPANL